MARGIARTLRLWHITGVAARTDYFGLINLITPCSYAPALLITRSRLQRRINIYYGRYTDAYPKNIILCLHLKNEEKLWRHYVSALYPFISTFRLL